MKSEVGQYPCTVKTSPCQQKCWVECLFHRPGVAGAVLETLGNFNSLTH